MRPGPPVAVVARQASKAYGATVALDRVDVDVPAGTVHGLLGPNGAGKSTLLRALLGLVRLDSGSLEVTGTVAGFVDSPGAYPYLTGRQNLEFLARLDDAPGNISAVLDQVELGGRADTKVGGWSLGMRQRLAIAAGLLRDPDVLVLDEPSNGLDPAAAGWLRRLIAGLASQGRTVVLCTHDLAEVDLLCENVTVLVAARLLWQGPVTELRQRFGRRRLTTSDDDAAAAVRVEGVTVTGAAGRLVVTASLPAMDAYVLELARHGVAVRSLTSDSQALEDALRELAT